MDSHEQRKSEEEKEDITLGSDARPVRKLTGETPDMQNIRDITEPVMEIGEWKKFHQIQGNKSQDIYQQRDVS